MHFGLSEEQKNFAQMAAARGAGLRVDDRYQDGRAAAAHLANGKWLVPRRFGGDERSLLDVAAAIEVIARNGTEAAILGRAVLAPLAMLALGNATQQKKWLADICDGSARFAAAFEEPGNPSADSMPVLIDAVGANFVLLCRDDGRVAILDGGQLSDQLTASIDDHRRIGALPRSVQTVADLDAAGDPRGALRRVANAGRIALAADTLGAAQALCDRAVGYVQGRVQFGRVIGSYQGVKFNCADMVTMLEPCRALVWHAAYAHDARLEEADLLALHAKAHVSDVAREIGRMSVELHGAYGFSQESGLYRWVRRIAFNRQVLGSPDHCRAMAGELQDF
jgi:alkylation response protein AidB-like acyl-CoA dehydrogenase